MDRSSDFDVDLSDMPRQYTDIEEDRRQCPIFDDQSERAMGAEPVMAVPDGNEIPPERVRFTAPAALRPEGAEEFHDGAVLNLSTRGVAVSTDWPAKPNERVWLQFRLGLAEDPLDLLCEVIWRADHGAGVWLLGLRFASLTREEENRVRIVVTERSEGRAAEWPLPMVPDRVLQPNPRQTNPWLIAAAGMAAGIGMALAFSVIPSVSVSKAKTSTINVPAPISESLNADDGTTAPTLAVKPSTASVAPKQKSTADSTSDQIQTEIALPAAKPQSRSSLPEPRMVQPTPKIATSIPATKSSTLLPRKVSTDTKSQTNEAVLRPTGSKSSVELALLTDGPINDHVSFWLDNPKRLVIDVFGRRSGFALKDYRIAHPLVKSLRVGSHHGKVRFVIETANDVSSQVKAKVSGSSLLVELKRK